MLKWLKLKIENTVLARNSPIFLVQMQKAIEPRCKQFSSFSQS